MWRTTRGKRTDSLPGALTAADPLRTYLEHLEGPAALGTYRRWRRRHWLWWWGWGWLGWWQWWRWELCSAA